MRILPLLRLLPMFLWLAPSAVAGEWRSVRDEPAQGMGVGLAVIRREVKAADGRSAELAVVQWSAATHGLRVVDQGEMGRATTAVALAEAGAAAGVNGGYFHPDRRPLGLVISGGRMLHGFERARLLGGLVTVDAAGTMRLMRAAEFALTAAANAPGRLREALQAGPFLVDGGRPVPGLEATRGARRTAVATDGRGRWALVAVLSRLTLAETADLLAAPGALPAGFTVSRALNLDGGSSTALWARREASAGGGDAVSETEWGTVRNFLGVFPR